MEVNHFTYFSGQYSIWKKYRAAVDPLRASTSKDRLLEYNNFYCINAHAYIIVPYLFMTNQLTLVVDWSRRATHIIEEDPSIPTNH